MGDQNIIDEGQIEEEQISRIWFRMITGGDYDELKRYHQFNFSVEGMETMMRAIRFLVGCEQPGLRETLVFQKGWKDMLREEHRRNIAEWEKEHNKEQGH